MISDEMVLIPKNTEAEQAVLGGLILDNGSERSLSVLGMLKPESFYSFAHQKIFESIKELHRQEKPVDLITLSEVLDEKGITESIGGFAYLAELSKNTPSAANIKNYAQIVREKAMERYGVKRLTDAIEMLTTRSGLTTGDKFDAVSSVFSDLANYSKSGNKKGLRKFSDVFGDWTLELEKRYSGDKSVRGLSTGLPSLDKMLAPKLINRGSLMVIGATPKTGKTTLYTQLAINCAVVEEKPALMFSLEMPSDQILEKVISQKSGISSDIFHPNPLDLSYEGDFDGDWKKAMGVADRIMDIGNLYIDDTPGISLADVVMESRRIHRERGEVGMILVDYLTLMTADKAERNDLAYGMITKGLKNLAKELNCVVVLLSQLNRGVNNRPDKRPIPSDSRDTGQIEQDCDYWIGLYRDGMYNESVDQSETEVILRLNRHGKAGTVYCTQRNGAIYDCDQEEARNKIKSREPKPAKTGKDF